MRMPLIAGNWKMNKTVGEAVQLVEELKKLVADVKDVEIAVAPPFTALYPVAQALKGSNIKLAAQDVFWEDSGAYTGEISPVMLKDLGCQYVIVGHSERRQYFGETNETVNRKVKAVLRHGMRPIMCVGEKLEEREAGKTMEVVKDHVVGGLEGLSEEEMERVVIAYEPVWAIGTGRTATPQQAQEVHQFIRELLAEMFSKETAERVRIQYGGSIKPENIAGLMAQPDIDGGLVGGASLQAESFAKIVKFYER
ncbi:triose-phosphate isomerase [Candidatus Poribacteria bacterium]|nr:MAG: triose-phosphate isomerase [Candidatus Poribacteria bacterium]